MLHQLLDIKKGIDEHPLIVGHIIKREEYGEDF